MIKMSTRAPLTGFLEGSISMKISNMFSVSACAYNTGARRHQTQIWTAMLMPEDLLKIFMCEPVPFSLTDCLSLVT